MLSNLIKSSCFFELIKKKILILKVNKIVLAVLRSWLKNDSGPLNYINFKFNKNE